MKAAEKVGDKWPFVTFRRPLLISSGSSAEDRRVYKVIGRAIYTEIRFLKYDFHVSFCTQKFSIQKNQRYLKNRVLFAFYSLFAANVEFYR